MGQYSIGGDIFLEKDYSRGAFHVQVFFYLTNPLSGLQIWAMFGENFVIWSTVPIYLQSSVTDVGGFIARIAAVFCGSGEMPWWSMAWPKKVILVCENWHFSAFNVVWASGVFDSFKYCFQSITMLTRSNPKSSTWHNTPRRPHKASSSDFSCTWNAKWHIVEAKSATLC